VAAAYLFAGPRGTGKTSTARILAKAVNCVHAGEPEVTVPCNQCPACVSIGDGTCLDIVELDAASHTGVDDVRDVIISKVQFPPTEVRRKVYIVDEVHKLSNAAFNALLKTLEEPPGHVVFVLATTDPQNVPPTILSRCQRFEFHRIEHAVMVRHLRHVCQVEGIQAEEGALHAIADASEGAMRDALVILEQVAAQGEVGEGTVLATLGLTPPQALARLTDLVLGGDAGGAIALLHQLQAEGKDPAQLAKDAVEWWRKLLLYRVAGDPAVLMTMGSGLAERLQAQAASVTTEQAWRLVRLGLSLLEEMREAAWVTVLWEAALVRMAHPDMDAGSDALAARVTALERHLAGEKPPPPAPAKSRPPSPAPAASPQALPAMPPAPAGDMPLPELWKRLLSVLQRKESGPLYTYIAEARPVSLDAGRLTISLGQGKSFQKERIELRKEAVEQATAEVAGRVLQLRVVLEGEGPGPAGAASAEAPGKVHESFVKNATDIFGGHIVE
jgi:DNA polymerase-3 subunit gamma/tau